MRLSQKYFLISIYIRYAPVTVGCHVELQIGGANRSETSPFLRNEILRCTQDDKEDNTLIV
ncbi:hypothetical protein [Dysgonomonas reticulitermitis]